MTNMPLFVDPLDIWLMILGATVLSSAYLVYLTAGVRYEPISLRGLAYFYIIVGIYALAMGIWGTAVWPLPSSYNLVLTDPYALFGIAALVVGISLYLGQTKYVGLPMLFLGIIPVVYGVDIAVNHMTTEPGLAAAMYITIGLAAILAPFAYTFNLGRGNRYVGYIIMILLIIGGLLAYVIGISAAFEHVHAFARWSPWYGVPPSH